MNKTKAGTPKTKKSTSHRAEDDSRIVLMSIASRPGCTKTEARDQTGLGRKFFDRAIQQLTGQGTVLVFETHGREYLLPEVPGVDNWWLQLVTLRVPHLEELHRELCTAQVWQFTKILCHMETTEDWVHSTTQRRLRRLEEARLVESFRKTRDLRTRFYRAIPPHPAVTKILGNDEISPDQILDGRFR